MSRKFGLVDSTTFNPGSKPHLAFEDFDARVFAFCVLAPSAIIGGYFYKERVISTKNPKQKANPARKSLFYAMTLKLQERKDNLERPYLSDTPL